MARLECPECSSVLKPAKMPAPGKKVRCPKCEAIFEVPKPGRGESDLQTAPARKKKVQATAKPKAKAKPKPKSEEEEGYGFRDPIEEDAGPEIDYAPDLESKNPRGPATELLAQPTTWLLRFAMLNLLGSLVFIVCYIWPFMFTPYGTFLDPKDYEGITSKDKSQQTSTKFDAKKQVKPDQLNDADRAVWDDDVADDQQYRGLMAGLGVLLFIYTGCLAYGAVQMQNLESYGWSMAACILALPIPDTLGFGIWGIRQLRSENVKAAFSYVSD